MNALVFDFGGPVLLTPFELRRIGERELGLAPGTFTWSGPFDPAADPDWQVFQSGGMNEREYWARRVQEFHDITGLPADMKQMCRYLYAGSQEEVTRPGARALIRDAKAHGIPVGILTNDLRSFHDEEWLERMPVLEEFDFWVEGRTDGVYKPDPAAYRLMIERMGVEPGDCVFIDDQPVNIQGAAAEGMRTVHLDPTDPEPGFRLARDMLGLPEE